MSLSIYINMSSACGRISNYPVEVEDVELNPYGIECCDECRTIIALKESNA